MVPFGGGYIDIGIIDFCFAVTRRLLKYPPGRSEKPRVASTKVQMMRSLIEKGPPIRHTLASFSLFETEEQPSSAVEFMLQSSVHVDGQTIYRYRKFRSSVSCKNKVRCQ